MTSFLFVHSGMNSYCGISHSSRVVAGKFSWPIIRFRLHLDIFVQGKLVQSTKSYLTDIFKSTMLFQYHCHQLR